MNNKKKKKDLPLYALVSEGSPYRKPGKYTTKILKEGLKRRMYDPHTRTHQIFTAKKDGTVKKGS